MGCAPDLTGRVERGAAAKAGGALVVTSVRSRGGNIEVAADCCDCASGKEGVVGAAVFAFLFFLSLRDGAAGRRGTGERSNSFLAEIFCLAVFMGLHFLPPFSTVGPVGQFE